MKALVTGATGFLGSHLVERLVDDGADVAVLRRSKTDPWRIRHCLEQIKSIRGDLTELDKCADEIASFAPDIVFHLGWHGVDNAHRNDVGQIEVNVGATARLAQLAAALGCRVFVGAGSHAEYGPQNCRLSESASTMPTTLYGAAKLAAYHTCRVMLASSGVRFAWVRVFSTYGPRDNPTWLIPSLIDSMLARQHMPLTAGEQQWDYLYAADAARAFALVASCERAEGVFNLGSGKCVPLRQIVESIRDRIDPALPLGFGEVPYRNDQVMHLDTSVSRLTAITGWKPQIAFQDGSARTIKWHSAKRAGNAGQFNSCGPNRSAVSCA